MEEGGLSRIVFVLVRGIQPQLNVEREVHRKLDRLLLGIERIPVHLVQCQLQAKLLSDAGAVCANAVALHFMHYNFVRIHASLRMTPAMVASVTDRLWEVSDIVALIEAKEAEKPNVRGPYKKRGN